MISHKWLYLADIFEHQIMLMNNLRNFPPVTLGIFQSTLLQEERLKLKYIQNGNSYFNPRSYKRSDAGLVLDNLSGRLISIHAPTRGATSCLVSWYSLLHISIHAPTRGATNLAAAETLPSTISIHAPTRGATRFRFRDNISTFYFNPRSYKRSDFLVDAAAQ